MKINQNGSTTAKVPLNTINTMMEQISNLQEDQETLQSQVDALGQSISTVSLDANDAQIDTLNTTNMTATEAEVNTLSASVSVNTAQLSAGSSDIGIAHADSLSTPAVVALSANISYGSVTKLNSTTAEITNLTADNIEAENADIDAIKTDGITNSGDYTGKKVTVEDIESDSVTADTADIGTVNVTDTLNVKDINVDGAVTGLSDLTADSVTSDEAHIESIENQKIYTSALHPLTPTPLVDNNDRYTVELPAFAGTFVLTWKDGDAVRWTATVIGSGTNYQITFACTEEEHYITDLFQWNNKLYIRHNANGQLFYSYNAEKELEPIHIYYNMVGWAEDKSLEELTDEETHYQPLRPAEVVQFGATFIPRLSEGSGLDGTINFKGSCAFNELPSLSDTDVGDVWNITNEAYTDNRFVEGAGKPINAGDDVVAVEVDRDTQREDEINNIGGNGNSYEYQDIMLIDDNTVITVVGDTFSKIQNGVVVAKSVPNPGEYYIHLTKNSQGVIIATGDRTRSAQTMPLYSLDSGTTWYIASFEDPSIMNGNAATPFVVNDVFYLINTYYNLILGRYEFNSYYSEDGMVWKEYNLQLPLPEGMLGRNFADIERAYVISDNEVYITVGTAGDIMYVSHDLCQTWEVYDAVLETYFRYLRSDCYIENKTIVGIEGGRLYISYDLGITKQEIIKPIDDNINAVYYDHIHSSLIIGSGTAHKSYISYDLGQTWEELNNYYLFTDGWWFSSIYGHICQVVNTDTDYYFLGKEAQLYDNKLFIFRYLHEHSIQWDKFAAGVNYENFVAQNITASTALKSEGTLEVDGATTLNTLEVDGTSQFDDDVTVNADLNADKVVTPDLEVTDVMTANSTGVNVTADVTQTGNYTATGNQTITGNLTRTGNETISGVVIIGELD